MSAESKGTDSREDTYIGFDLAGDLDSYRTDEPTDDVPILRDDRAPVDSLLDNAVGQRYVRVRANDSNGTAAVADETASFGEPTPTLPHS